MPVTQTLPTKQLEAVHTDTPDRLLVGKVKLGCALSYAKLFEIYGDKLYYFALGYIKSPIEAEGVVQDVFVKVWEKRESLKLECSFKSYIFTIAFNLVKKVFNKRKRLRKYIDSKEIIHGFDFSTENQIEYNFMMEWLNNLVGEMPERRRETFIQSRFNGLPVKEIAKEMNVSPKTVENQITAALKFIKAHWDIDVVSKRYKAKPKVKLAQIEPAELSC